MKNAFDPAEVGRIVYGDDRHLLPDGGDAGAAPGGAGRLHGPRLPDLPPRVLAVLKCILSGISYTVPDYAVCIECKRNENVCLFDRGVTCLGPVTRAGCNSWCVNNGNVCYGCRGLVSNPNEKGMLQVLTAHGIGLEHVVRKMEMYNRCREEGAGSDPLPPLKEGGARHSPSFPLWQRGTRGGWSVIRNRR